MKKSYLRFSSQSGLSDSDILDIRAALSSGNTYAQVSRLYGIDETTVGRIDKAQTWSHVPQPKQFGNYTIYPDGRIFSKAAGRFMSVSFDKDGRRIVELRTGGNRERVAVATLVAKAFISNKIRSDKSIQFVDGNPANAHFTNISLTK